MKFFTFAILPIDCPLDGVNIECTVKSLLEPYKMAEGDDPYNPHWKWDYYCLYGKEELKKYEFMQTNYPFLDSSGYPIMRISDLKEDLVPFALVTPKKEWFNGSYPLENEDVTWPARAVTVASSFGGNLGVFVYCHS